jgi:hypothetical protein
MNQNFSAEQLLKLCKKNELEEYDIKIADLSILIEDSYTKISNGTFEFNIEESRECFLSKGLVDKLILRKLNDNLKRLYKDEQANRRVIINQVKTLLNDTCPLWILRTDISNFYESIDRDKLIEKLKSDSLLSYFSIWLINKLFSHPLLTNKTGLPRGISISSTLSEIYMRKFDRWVRSINGIYYYARFVDDIIIFGNKKNSLEDINKLMNENLEKGLTKNKSKTRLFNGSDMSHKGSLEYLGYKFSAKMLGKNSKCVTISIADKKVKKIKSKIVYSFVDYVKNRDFNLLENRIKFLTGNYSIKNNKEGNDLKAGIFYNYSHINDFSILVDLNIFYQRILNAKRYSLGQKLSSLLSADQKEKLSKYSFKHGFIKRVHTPFKATEMKLIKNCWQ